MVITWLCDPVYQIREEAIIVLVNLKEKVFNEAWLEEILTAKLTEFSQNPKFVQRIHTLIIIQKTYQHVSKEFLNTKMFQMI
mmetsp:Transcript_17459/g.16672  ORF Transcript_17459/g.16672 Transcript_17459/m.16672 type:complete len:82 (+) Transcript_17459:1372-1617(+)